MDSLSVFGLHFSRDSTALGLNTHDREVSGLWFSKIHMFNEGIHSPPGSTIFSPSWSAPAPTTNYYDNHSLIIVFFLVLKGFYDPDISGKASLFPGSTHKTSFLENDYSRMAVSK